MAVSPFPAAGRRRFLLGAAASAVGGPAWAQSWYPLKGDDGRPVVNTRLPVELLSDLDRLPGLYSIGSREPDVTVYEFFDYNCPFCRQAAPELAAMARDVPGLRIVLVNNPVLGQGSRDAAAVETAVLRLGGPEQAGRFHEAMYERPGAATRDKAVAVAGAIGLSGTELAAAAADPQARAAVNRHLQVAAALGFTVTPSFVFGGAGVFGFPGNGTMRRMIEEVRRCGEIVCKS